MPKAKSLDRLELTRRKMAGKGEIEKDFALREIKFAVTKSSQTQDITPFNTYQLAGKLEQHFDKCPSCGEMALVHEGGCEHCLNCGHDACGLH